MSTGDHNPDNIFVSSAHDERNQGIKSEHISKVCRIDQSKDIIGITTQKSVINDNPKLSSNYRTNDRMLQ